MTAAIQPVRRNLKFHLPRNKVGSWNPVGAHWTHFYNTLSLFFPVGERFFIQSIRNYRDQITDPKLQEAVRAFIAQEAFHGREHDEYNEALAAAGFPVRRFEAQVTALLNWVQQIAPNSVQLAATTALEHLTALMGDIILRDPQFLDNADEHFAALWRWHAMEETEHKGVAYDVYEAMMGTGPRAYVERTAVLIVATTVFWALFYPYYFQMVKHEGVHLDLRGWWTSFRYQWLNPGALRRLVPAWLDYFKPGFHPWDHDNRAFLEMAPEIEAKVAEFALRMASQAEASAMDSTDLATTGAAV
ncbi:MAG: metal-dependent hydrolase [Hahellaceae bacterium]|nr:metal-dependent hydrolase [Hahellaceae bacterium]MCP5169204.1 metal-dependent hydrolase [Hahellaceae bacterium]